MHPQRWDGNVMGTNEHMVGSISYKREHRRCPRVLPDRWGSKSDRPSADETYENPPYARTRAYEKHSSSPVKRNLTWEARRGRHIVSMIQKNFSV